MAKKITGEVALVNDHGQNFAILAVSDDAVADPQLREETITACERQFGAPTVLLAENGKTWGPGGPSGRLALADPDRSPALARAPGQEGEALSTIPRPASPFGCVAEEPLGSPSS